MHWKRTLVLLLFNVVLGIAILFSYLSSRKHEEPNERRVIPAGLVEASDTIIIDSRDFTQRRVLKRAVKGWAITEPVQWSANLNAMAQLKGELQLLSWQTRFPVNSLRADQSLADYGLQEPMMSITLGQGEQLTTLKIGRPTGSREYRYTLSLDEKFILVTAFDLIKKMAADLDMLRSTALFDVPLYQIRSFSLETAESNKVVLSRDDNRWLFELPIQTTADSQAVYAALSQLLSTNIGSFVEPDPVGQGLEESAVRVTLEIDNRPRQILLIGQPVSKPPTEDDSFDTQKDTTAYLYARFESDSAGVFTIPSAALNAFKEAQVKLRERRFVLFDREQVTSIDISDSIQAVSLQKLEDGRWQVLTKDPEIEFLALPAEWSAVEDAIQALSDLEATRFISDAPSASDIQTFIFDDLQRQVTIKTDNQERILYIGADGVDYYAKMDDSDSIYAMKPQTILPFIPSRFLHYRLRLLDEQPEAAQVVSFKLTKTDATEPLLEMSIDPENGTWDNYLAQNAADSRQAVLDLIDLLKQFRVKQYISDTYDPAGLNFAGQQHPWLYQLEATFRLPPVDAEAETTTLLYSFTEPLSRTIQYGGSPQASVSFSCTADWIKVLDSLISKEIPAFLSQP